MKKLKNIVDQKINSLEDLKKIFQQIIPQFNDRTLLLLSGPVGAGKTTSVQVLAALLGITHVASPSFAIHNRYENTTGQSIDHVDLYRLNDEDDLESTGFWDLFGQQKSIVIVEWADRLDSESLPLNWFQVRVHIDLVPEMIDQRHIRIDAQS